MLLLYIRLYISLPQIGTCFTSSMSRFSFMLLTEKTYNFPISVSFFPYVPCLYLTFLTEKTCDSKKISMCFAARLAWSTELWTLLWGLRTKPLLLKNEIKRANTAFLYEVFLYLYLFTTAGCEGNVYAFTLAQCQHTLVWMSELFPDGFYLGSKKQKQKHNTPSSILTLGLTYQCNVCIILASRLWHVLVWTCQLVMLIESSKMILSSSLFNST